MGLIMRRSACALAMAALMGVCAPAMASTDHAVIEQQQSETDEGLRRGDHGYKGDAVTYAYPGSCGIQVNSPHFSTSYREIHTRITSFCNDLPLASNTVSGKTYRSRWYGWEQVGDLPASTKTEGNVQNYRRTATAPCDSGSLYRYRTEGFGTINTGAQSYSAAAYEQNDTEISCG